MANFGTLSLTDRSSKLIGYFQSFQLHEISPASRVCDINKGKNSKNQNFLSFTPSKGGAGGSKMKVLARWTKLNQILYTYSVGPLKARNGITNHPKWGEGQK